jgi:hypothetical protein
MGVTIPGPSGEVLEQYEVSNSLRLNRADSAYLTKASIGATTGSGKTFTFSAWVKRSGLGSEQYIIHARSADSQGNFARLEFNSGDAIRFRGYSTTYLATNRLYRDVSAWYHLVLAVDTDTSGDGNSVRLYVNGVEETDFATDTHPSTDDDLILGSDRAHYLGASYYNNSVGAAFDGYMAEVHLVDGQQLTPSYFGKFDDNNVWIPKRYTGTFGGNGFKFEFKQTGTSANSSGIGADTSGNDSHFTPTNLAATDVTEDTCTNNFATLNPLAFGDNAGTLSEGNLKHTHNSGDSDVVSTIGISSGKFYAEFKAETVASNRPAIAVYNDYDSGATNYGSVNGSVLFLQDGRILVDNSSIGDFGSISQDDIIQVAVDNDNGAIYIGQNGSYLNSGDPTSGSSRTGSVSNFTAGSVTCFIGTRANSNSFASANFGNPAFSISSGNTDGKYGNFEYAPPSGYYALCTKRLAEFG